MQSGANIPFPSTEDALEDRVMEERASLNPSPGMLLFDSMKNHCIRTYTFESFQNPWFLFLHPLREVSIEAILSTLIYSILC